MKRYDYLIVGSGLYGAVFAQQAQKKGKKVLVIDKRPNIAGNVYTEDIEKIHVHKYGASQINREYEQKYHLQSQLLHAARLQFPVCTQTLCNVSKKEFTAPLPKQFYRIAAEKGVL